MFEWKLDSKIQTEVRLVNLQVVNCREEDVAFIGLFTDKAAEIVAYDLQSPSPCFFEAGWNNIEVNLDEDKKPNVSKSNFNTSKMVH